MTIDEFRYMARDKISAQRHLVIFPDVSGHKVVGELDLAGRDTSVRLFHDGALPPLQTLTTLHGEMQDFTKFTCLECVPNGQDITRSADGREAHIGHLFPHFVTLGNRHLDPNSACIEEISFTVDDINSLFYDFDAFGQVIDATSLIDAVAKANKLPRIVHTGDVPLIAYFTGRLEVVSVDTAIGLFSVRHVPSYSTGGPSGVFIKNKMAVSLCLAEPIAFEESIERISSLLRFLTVMAGRAQSLRDVRLTLVAAPGVRSEPLKLHWSFRPAERREKGSRDHHRPHPGDVPLNPVERPQEFAAVLRHFVQREPTWHIARVRLAGCLDKGNSYDVDRLVAAANMFDLLPADAVPVDPTLPPELLAAQKGALETFKKLPSGVERDSVVGALKRMTHPSLPKKVLYRVSIVQSVVGARLADLDFVVKTAVKVRNHFVHGESDDFDYKAVEPFAAFLTDALEFVFLASDLIEAGWDAARWFAEPYGWGHSLTRFRSEYDTAVRELKRALGK